MKFFCRRLIRCQIAPLDRGFTRYGLRVNIFCGASLLHVRGQACDLKQTLLHPRFAVVTHCADGSEKVRPVDHFSWSASGGNRKLDSLIGYVRPMEKMRH